MSCTFHIACVLFIKFGNWSMCGVWRGVACQTVRSQSEYTLQKVVQTTAARRPCVLLFRITWRKHSEYRPACYTCVHAIKTTNNPPVIAHSTHVCHDTPISDIIQSIHHLIIGQSKTAFAAAVEKAVRGEWTATKKWQNMRRKAGGALKKGLILGQHCVVQARIQVGKSVKRLTKSSAYAERHQCKLYRRIESVLLRYVLHVSFCYFLKWTHP